MAKQMTGNAHRQRPKRKVLRELKKTQDLHEKAERQVGKLRVRLERAEAKLAQRAQRLLLVQAKLHPSGGRAEPETEDEDQDGDGLQGHAENSLPVLAAAVTPATDGDSRSTASVAATSRRVRPSRPRAKRRPATGQSGK